MTPPRDGHIPIPIQTFRVTGGTVQVCQASLARSPPPALCIFNLLWPHTVYGRHVPPQSAGWRRPSPPSFRPSTAGSHEFLGNCILRVAELMHSLCVLHPQTSYHEPQNLTAYGNVNRGINTDCDIQHQLWVRLAHRFRPQRSPAGTTLGACRTCIRTTSRASTRSQDNNHNHVIIPKRSNPRLAADGPYFALLRPPLTTHPPPNTYLRSPL